MTPRSRTWLFVVLAALSVSFVAGAQDQQAQIDFANGLFSRGLFAEAADEYRAYLEQYPQGPGAPTARYRLGESLYHAQKYQEAIAAFDAFLAASPPAELTPRARLRKGIAQYQIKELDAAQATLSELVKTDIPTPLRAEGLYYLGKLHTDAGRATQAIGSYKTLLEVAPDHALSPYARYQLAYVYTKSNDHENAAIAFSEVAGDPNAPGDLRMESRFRAAEIYDKLGWFDAAVQAYERLEQEFPDTDYARRAAYGHAWALYHAGQYEQALAAAAEFLKENADAPRAAGVLYLRGNSLQQQKNYAEAAAAFQAIREKFPDSPFAKRALYKAAWVQHLAGNNGAAKQLAEQYLAAAPAGEYPGDALFLIASIEAAAGEHEAALARYQRIEQEFPDSEFAVDAGYKLGETLAQLGRLSEASGAFERFATAHPEHPLAADALLRAGDAAFAAGDFGKSAALYERMLERPRADLTEGVVYRLAVARHNAGDKAGGAAAFRQLIEQYPQSARAVEARLRVGQHLLREEADAVKSLEYFKAALEAAPEGPLAGEIIEGMALARFETKDFEGAADLLAKILVDHPDTKLNAETYAWLGQHHFDREEWPESIRAFEALLQNAPDYANGHRIVFLIGRAQEGTGNAKEALRRYAEVQQAAPQTPAGLEAQYRSARLLEAAGDMATAVVAYEQAAGANTGEWAARARFRLGEIMESQNKFDEAARHFMRVAILFLHDELSPESLWRAGQAFEKAQKPDEARRTYEELARDYPESDQARRAQERLSALGG